MIFEGRRETKATDIGIRIINVILYQAQTIGINRIVISGYI